MSPNNLPSLKLRVSEELVDSDCPVCGKEEEDVEHYEFGCSKAEELKQAVARKAGREQLSREERQRGWGDLIVMIVNVRFIYHKVRCSVDNSQKKKMQAPTTRIRRKGCTMYCFYAWTLCRCQASLQYRTHAFVRASCRSRRAGLPPLNLFYSNGFSLAFSLQKHYKIP